MALESAGALVRAVSPRSSFWVETTPLLLHALALERPRLLRSFGGPALPRAKREIARPRTRNEVVAPVLVRQWRSTETKTRPLEEDATW
jgi:hypothetical protein